MPAVADTFVLFEQLLGVAANRAHNHRSAASVHTNNLEVGPRFSRRFVYKTDETPPILGAECDQLLGEMSATGIGLEHERPALGSLAFELVEEGALHVAANTAPDDGSECDVLVGHF